jgi:5-methyltetrahydrofolate--homocysteine methyltransferase
MEILDKIAQSVKKGGYSETPALIQTALDQGLKPNEILNKALFAAMEEVGVLFREEDIFIPEVLLSARAMQAAIDVMAPRMVGETNIRRGKVLLGTVKGDVHNLGKNLVNVMLRGAGYDVVDVGENIAAEVFAQRAVEEDAQIIGMSALLTTTMGRMAEVIEAVEEAGLKGKIKTLVGGACVTQRFADEIGADGFAENAGQAVAKVRELLDRS